MPPLVLHRIIFSRSVLLCSDDNDDLVSQDLAELARHFLFAARLLPLDRRYAAVCLHRCVDVQDEGATFFPSCFLVPSSALLSSLLAFFVCLAFASVHLSLCLSFFFTLFLCVACPLICFRLVQLLSL